jgi:hypothetical protein
MKQLAWLEFYRGKWHLMTSNPGDPIRQWTDRKTALSDLAGEGWDISGRYPKRPGVGVKSWGIFQGYALRRLVH